MICPDWTCSPSSTIAADMWAYQVARLSVPVVISMKFGPAHPLCEGSLRTIPQRAA